MLHRLQGSLSGLRRRLATVGSGFVDALLRDNKVIPLVLALLALFVFAWIVAGIFLAGPEEDPTSNRANVAQSQDPGVSDPPAPEIEIRNVESYAAYQFKDPFRQLLAPAETTTATTTPETTAEVTIGEDTTGETTGREPGRNGGASDTDGDGLPDRRESALDLNPNNPDTDGDGILDGEDSSGGGSRGTRNGGGGNRAGGNNGLFNTGGNLNLP